MRKGENRGKVAVHMNTDSSLLGKEVSPMMDPERLMSRRHARVLSRHVEALLSKL